MTAWRRALVALAVALAGLAWAQPEDWPHPAEMTFEPVDFAPLEPRREVLDNGLVVYLAEDPSLPLVQGTAYVDAPHLFDPEGHEGLASFTAALLREGGAGGRTPDELDAAVEFLGATIEAGSDDVLASVSFSALAEHVDEVLPLWRDVLVAPEFAPQRVEVHRQRQLEALRRIEDQPVQLALREFQARVAADHPAGAHPTEASLQAIERADLRAFHDAYYAPQRVSVAVTGDFDGDAMLQRLQDAFGDWTQEAEAPPELPPFDPEPEATVYLAPKEVQQSVIMIGTPAMRAYQPPYTAFSAADHVLGSGGFGSRLFREIRSERGLAYSTGSMLTQGFEVPGTFLAFAFTRADATAQTLELLLANLRRLHEEGVSEAELERSVTTLTNQALFRDASIAERTARAARVALLGLEPGYFEAHLERLQALTPAEVREAVRETYDPDGLVILVVGDPDAFDRPLEDFGPVQRIDIE